MESPNREPEDREDRRKTQDMGRATRCDETRLSTMKARPDRNGTTMKTPATSHVGVLRVAHESYVVSVTDRVRR